MKRLVCCMVLVIGLAQFSNLGAQEKLVYLGPIDMFGPIDMPAATAITPPKGLAFYVNIVDTSRRTKYLIDYASGQAYDMEIGFLNLPTNTTQTIKVELDLRYNDGAGYYVKRVAFSNLEEGWYYYSFNATSYVAKLGVLTLTGRVYGTGMGNNNKVTSQLYVY